MSFVVVDAQRQSLAGLEGPLRGLFRLEQLGRVEDLAETAGELAADLGPEDAALAGAFVELINHVILPKLTRENAERLRITELEELPSMLTQRIERITQGWEMRGWEKGRRELFLKLFATKHGDVPAAVRERIAAADADQLETWAQRLLRTESPEDVFKD